MTSERKTKKNRDELPAPPYAWISWIVLISYVIAAFEGAALFFGHPWLTDLSFNYESKSDAAFAPVRLAQFHLCCIYIMEIAFAIGPGWCAMSPGWTKGELLQHHAPYVAAVCLAFFGGHANRWTAPMVATSLTPANEGMFIANSLGAPEWLNKFRRLFGFIAISVLWCIETWTEVRNIMVHWSIGWDAFGPFLVDQIAWVGIAYHTSLLRMYVRRWKRTGRL